MKNFDYSFRFYVVVGGAPVASPVGAGAGGGAVESQLQQLQLHRQQQYQRLQQLQAQRDHVAHHHAAVKQVRYAVVQKNCSQD